MVADYHFNTWSLKWAFIRSLFKLIDSLLSMAFYQFCVTLVNMWFTFLQDITDKSRCWSEIDQSLTNLNLSIGSLVKRSASTSNDQLERQIQNSSFEDNSSPLPRCPSPLLVIKRCSEPPKDEVEENETNAVMKDSNSATHLGKYRHKIRLTWYLISWSLPSVNFYTMLENTRNVS